MITAIFRRRGAVALVAAALASGAGAALAQTNGNSVVVYPVHASASGVQFGFWENQTYQAQSLINFGHRPSARVAIDAWNSIESDELDSGQKGNYDWKKFDANDAVALARTHQYGESILAAVNVSFVDAISGGKRTIPRNYPQDITDPATHKAALAFLRAYVEHVLPKVGSFTLSVDYEIVSNYKLYTRANDNCDGASWMTCRDTRANKWSNWFVDAANAIRSEAAIYNAANGTHHVVLVQPIVNGDVIDPDNALNNGNNSWLATMVGGADLVAIDTYHCVNDSLVTDASSTLNAIERWNTLLQTSKKLVIAENGFSSGLKPNDDGSPTRCEDTNLTTGKYKGTADEQRAYYASLFPALLQATQLHGPLNGRLQSFHMWSIVDNPNFPVSDADHYFGVLGLPDPNTGASTIKPATQAVFDGINLFEAGTDASLSPIVVGTGVPWSPTGPALALNSGVDYSFLRFKGNTFGAACKVTITQQSVADGDRLLLKVNNLDWISAAASLTTAIPLTVSQCAGGAHNWIQLDVYATGSVFPASHLITSIKTSLQ